MKLGKRQAHEGPGLLGASVRADKEVLLFNRLRQHLFGSGASASVLLLLICCTSTICSSEANQHLYFCTSKGWHLFDSGAEEAQVAAGRRRLKASDTSSLRPHTLVA
jgi:hypothetical protein